MEHEFFNSARPPAYPKSSDLFFAKRASSLLEAQVKILRMVASGQDLYQTLDSLIRLMEAESGKALCSVLILDESGQQLHFASAPSLPKEYNDYIEGLKVGPQNGSCGTAIYRKEKVVVEDIASDPLWEAARPFALQYNLMACTSVPILDSRGLPLGTFAFYYKNVNQPSEYDLYLIEISKDLAGIAIERAKRKEERERLLKIEIEAREKAEQLIKMKDEFLSVASHELRTPLTALKMHLQFFELNLKKKPDPAKLQQTATEYIAKAKTQVDRMTKMAVNFLEAGQIRSGLLKLTRSRVNLADIIRRSISVNFGMNDPELVIKELPDVFGSWDEARLEQVIDNLLSNAKKYGRNNPVTLELKHGDSEAIFIVTDRGIGIPKELQGRIFNRFEQAHSRIDVTGFGLGLFIADQITRAHDGTISVSSEPGVGSTFTVRLPVKGGES